MKHSNDEADFLRKALNYHSRIVIGLVLFTATMANVWSQTGKAGTIIGRASNENTRTFLEGATVQLEAQNINTVTERDGSFRMTVPPGSHTITVQYVGLDPKTTSVVIAAGQTITLDIGLRSDIYRLETVVVAGEREGNAKAITLQRAAPNVKNIVSADAFGALAGSPADLLQRVPGITIDLVGGDIRYLSIRGISGPLNSVTMDGNRLASVTSDRGVQWQNTSSDTVESFEVTKAPTPDMDADAIGGTINMRSKSAFDYKERRMNLSLGGIKQYARRDDVHGEAAFSYSNILGREQRLGVSLNIGYRQHNALIDLMQSAWQSSADPRRYLATFRPTDFANVRTRGSLGLKLDYKLTGSTTLFSNFTYAPRKENNVYKEFIATTPQTIATLDPVTGNPTGTGAIYPDYSGTLTRVRAGLTNVVFTLNSNHLVSRTAVYTSQIGGKTRANGWEVDYDLWYSLGVNKQLVHTSAITLRGAGWTTDGTTDSRWAPLITFTGGPDLYNLDNYSPGLLSMTKRTWNDSIYGSHVDVKKKIDVAVPTYVKAGVKIREQTIERYIYNDRWQYTGPDGVIGSSDDKLSQFEDKAYTQRGLKLMDGRYPAFKYISVDSFRENKDSNPSAWRGDTAYRVMQNLQGRQTLEERVTSAYFLGNTKFGRLSILGGIRVEQTDVAGEGPLHQITPQEAARRAAFQGALTDSEIERRTRAEWSTRQKASRDYRNVFPGVHFKYTPLATDRLVLRGSYSNGIGRPDFSSIIPSYDVSYDAMTVRVQNAGVKPQYSDNFDVSAECYFEPVGLFSIGGFMKEIKSFIYNTGGSIIPSGANNGFAGDYAGFQLFSQANGGFARIKGWEASYQQQLRFLPGWWRGFGVFANYTWLDTKGDYGDIGNVVTTDALPGFVPRAANAGISYVGGKVDVRVAYGYTGRSLISYNAQDYLRNWKLPFNRVDIKAKYKWDRKWETYLDLYNVSGDNESRVIGSGANERPTLLYYRNDPQIHVGITARF